MTQFTNADNAELAKFDNVSAIWWDPKGEMGTLHTLNPLRTTFVMDNFPGQRPRILDVGCGGGILSEALARAGAQVTGIDLSPLSIKAAERHAREQGLDIDYRYQSVEDVAMANTGTFDAVTCMEMLEHVPHPKEIIAACALALKPGGQAFFSTINRTLKGFLFAIVGGEYILHLLPRGSHTFRKLIRPPELKGWAQESGMRFVRVSSLMFNPFNRGFKVADGRADVNYMMHFRLGKAQE